MMKIIEKIIKQKQTLSLFVHVFFTQFFFFFSQMSSHFLSPSVSTRGEDVEPQKSKNTEVSGTFP